MAASSDPPGEIFEFLNMVVVRMPVLYMPNSRLNTFVDEKHFFFNSRFRKEEKNDSGPA